MSYSDDFPPGLDMLGPVVGAAELIQDSNVIEFGPAVCREATKKSQHKKLKTPFCFPRGVCFRFGQ